MRDASMFLIRPEARFSPQEQLSQTRVPASPNIQIRSQRPFNPRKPTHNATAPRGAAAAPGKSDSDSAAVADTGPEANWFVTISGERGADGRVSIDRIDPATDSEEEGTSFSSLSCWPNCGGPGYGKPRATDSSVDKKPPVINGQ